MASGDFNRDMDAYLKRRKVVQRVNPLLAARRYFQGMFPKKEVKQELPLDIPPEQVEAVLKQSAMRKPTVTNTPLRSPTGAARRAEPVKATPAPQQQKSKSQVKSMGWFNKNKKEDSEYEMMETAPAQPVIDEEVKEVLKITFKWLKQMDPDTVEEIKSSPDFEKYKKVLDKYGLIKK